MNKRLNAKRWFGRWSWHILSWLPMFIRGPVVRRLFTVERDFPGFLIFKKAETPEELEQAFNLAYEAYSEKGLVADSESRLRVTKYHALPTTTVLVAKIGNEVIATISIIGDSAFGLPMEKLFDILAVRKQANRLAEISTLAIKRGFRRQRGRLLLGLCKFMNEYCLKILKVDSIVCSVHPSVSDFYRCVLMFEDIENGKVKSYEFVQGAKATGHFLNLGPPFEKKMETAFRGAPEHRNLFKYFCLDEISNFQFPETPFFSAMDFTMTPELVTHFFRDRTKVLDELSDVDRATVSNLYFYPEYRAVFGIFESLNGSLKRAAARFATNCPVRYYFFDTQQSFTGIATEISRQGMKIKVENYLPPKSSNEVRITIDISETESVRLTGQIIWDKTEEGEVGIWLNSFTPKVWHKMVDHFEGDLLSFAKSKMKSLTGRKVAGGSS